MKEYYVHKFPGYESFAMQSDRIDECLAEMKKRGIKNLILNSVWGWKKGKSIDFLGNNPWIEGVNIVEEGLLNSLKKLKLLVLSGDNYKGQVDFKNFSELMKFGGAWDTKRYAGLNSCFNCNFLTIRKFPWDDLEEINNLKKLEKLEINYGKLSSLKDVNNLSSLESLDLYSLPNLSSLSGIESISDSLEGLSIEKCKIIENYKPVGKLKNLKSLLISESSPVESVKFVRNMMNLTYVYIGTEILDQDPEPLKERGFEFKRSKSYK